MVHAQPRIREWDAQTLQGFQDTNVSPNLGQTTRSYNNQKKKKKKKKKKRTCRTVDFAVLADHRVKLKEREKYLDLAREFKKLWNIKVTIIPIVIGALGTVTKGLEQGLEDLEIKGRVETIQTSALLSSVRILWRVPETWGDLSLKLHWVTIS